MAAADAARRRCGRNWDFGKTNFDDVTLAKYPTRVKYPTSASLWCFGMQPPHLPRPLADMLLDFARFLE